MKTSINYLKNKGFVALSIALIALSACSKKATEDGPVYVPPTPAGPPVDKGWAFETTPTWADEFSTAGAPSAANWDYDTGGSGWGNNELQFYTNTTGNANVANGILTITAKKEAMGGRNYTSARMVTRNKLDALYGRFEIKAKLPSGRGTWPAIWMLPTDRVYGDWPKSGEIDIMEHVGYDQDMVHFTTHSEAYYFKINTQKSSTKKIDGVSTAFHLYRVDWTPYAIRGYFDDVKVFEFANEGTGYKVWPFDKRFHLLLNIAVGGDWGGAQGVDDSIWPQTMDIDYVRYYKMIDK
ncbi:glycoside hydrolase family 16 protein [Pedobacter sandarakinus]|uniref:glycoside hydrolase family 16 protein n=1 Tax=Pedobacter sandarakinus TaxID=353156 RepID=UPI002245B526|nr:glycoside hydrolase family 16 protein [Pedobacter sandarakinus]MCX2573381.1 glycoside hydrolase family 16 protein [Pedobacter sandarakinus]